MEMRVSVIVPTYKDWGRLRLCLQALEEQDLDGIDLEVVVVNNDPESLIPDNLQFSRRFKFVTEPKPGSYAARNRGIKVSSGEILAFTDADCIPDKFWIKNSAKKLMTNNNGVTRIGGRVELTFPDRRTIFDEYERLFSFRQKEFCETFGYSVTANMICFRSCFQKVGPFRSDLMSGGDTDWGQRAERCGEKILYCDDVVVFHPSRSGFNELKKKMKRVSGGVYSRNCASFKDKVMLLVKSAFPPVGSFKTIFQDADLSFSKKFNLMVLAYYFKLSRFFVFLLLISDISKPKRQ